MSLQRSLSTNKIFLAFSNQEKHHKEVSFVILLCNLDYHDPQTAPDQANNNYKYQPKMKFNFKLKRLCGAYYGHPTSSITAGGTQWSGSNVVYDSTGNVLISAVSNRIQVVDLRSHSVRTLPVEARSSIRCIALSPDDAVLVVVDVQNYALLINFRRGVILHRFRFKKTVRVLEYSPDGRYIAASHGKHVQVWCAPNHLHKEFAPLTLHRTYTGQADDVTCLTWSRDSSVLAAGSRDGTVRIWTLHTIRNFEPQTLAGHKRPVVGVFLESTTTTALGTGGGDDNDIDTCYTISEDGALVTWQCQYGKKDIEVVAGEYSNSIDKVDDDAVDEAVNFFTGGGLPPASKRRRTLNGANKTQAHRLVQGTWSVKSRHYFHQDDAFVSSVAYCNNGKLLSVGFSSGLFGLYEMPSVSNIHTLSVGSNQLVKTCALNKSGDWLALACPSSQQILVWEWRSETYVLKQRGHAYGMKCMAYSPDGVVICTGGEDGKLKLWNATSGFCYVTMEKTHTAPITAVAFANASVVLSASLDGTVRAHDLHRYRNFKTLTTPKPVQFLSLAIDPSGEIVTAGCMEPFHVYAWNLQTGKILDVYTGHTGPVCDLAFQPNGGVLVSASWDGTVKVWDLYKSQVPTESFSHTADVVCVACRPDGKEICTGTMGGLLSFWDVESGKLKFEIDGRRDIAGGRKVNDRMTADNNASSRYFTTVGYSADGACVLAGGNSKYVCIYAVAQQMLLRKFQLTFNRSLDGVLDELNSKNLGPGGVSLDDHANSDDETDYQRGSLPGARRGDDGSRHSRVEVLTHQVAFCSTGREWAAVSGEGWLQIYSLEDDLIFDPVALTEEITPAAVARKLSQQEYGLALRTALALNEMALIREVLDDTPFGSIEAVVQQINPEYLSTLLSAVATQISSSPHLEFYLEWTLRLLKTHGVVVERMHRSRFLRDLRTLHREISKQYEDLKAAGNSNRYVLAVLEEHGKLMASITSGSEEPPMVSN